MRRPTQDDSFLLVLRTAGWTAQAQCGSASCAPPGSFGATLEPRDLTLAARARRAGA